MTDNFEKWIMNWFVENSDVDEAEIKSNLNENYFEKKWIDSFKFMSFITDIEEEFDIMFSNDEFQNRGFASITGLAEILNKKQNE